MDDERQKKKKTRLQSGNVFAQLERERDATVCADFTALPSFRLRIE